MGTYFNTVCLKNSKNLSGRKKPHSLAEQRIAPASLDATRHPSIGSVMNSDTAILWKWIQKDGKDPKGYKKVLKAEILSVFLNLYHSKMHMSLICIDIHLRAHSTTNQVNPPLHNLCFRGEPQTNTQFQNIISAA